MKNRTIARYWILWLGLVLAAGLIALALWHLLGRRAVSVVKPTVGPAVQAVYATGTVEPQVLARIGPETTGRIVEMLVEEGEAVEEGRVLARLENRVAAARVQELEARARYQQEEAERNTRLFDRRIISEQARDLAISEWKAAEAALAVAREQLEQLTLRAPFDGRVIREEGEVGEVATPGDTLYWIGCCLPLRIEAEVDEEDIPLVQLEQTALIRADAFPDQTFRGEVTAITPQGDPVARSYRVRITLPPEAPLLIGMTAEINIVVRVDEQALLVPVAALDGKRVWVVTDGEARPRPVEIGVIAEERAEIRSGLRWDEMIIVDPPQTLEPGDRVHASEAELD